MQPFPKYYFILLLIVCLGLSACGGSSDDAPIRLERIRLLDSNLNEFTNNCNLYTLDVQYEGIEDYEGRLLVEKREVDGDEVYESVNWSNGGGLFFNDQRCNSEADGWVEAENLCRFDVVITNPERTLESRRETVEVKC